VLEDNEVVEHTKGFVSDVVADDTVQRTGKETGVRKIRSMARPF
jgi:hypothetical protein